MFSTNMGRASTESGMRVLSSSEAIVPDYFMNVREWLRQRHPDHPEPASLSFSRVYTQSAPSQGSRPGREQETSMGFMTWSDEYVVGIAKIDSQHQRLVELINELYDGMRAGKGGAILGGIIAELKDYSVQHFKTEEELFDRHLYPEAKAHKAEHDAFIAKVSAFQADYQAKKIGVTLDILNFLVDWLKDHILKSDKSYAPFLASKGVR
jgi:hemerythrin-like metal-binding domain